MAEESPFRPEAVDENVLRSLPCPTASSHEIDDDDEHDGPSSMNPNQLTNEQIPSALSALKDDTVIKTVMRNQCMDFKNSLRPLMWKALYLRMEALAGSTTDALNAVSLAEATAGLYHDTIQTCFGTQELISEEIGLPSCIDHNHTNSYYLNSLGKVSVARLLTCFSYNQPDLQYCPMLYPIASILRHFMSGKQK
jgi:hypothetical protein